MAIINRDIIKLLERDGSLTGAELVEGLWWKPVARRRAICSIRPRT